jgi:two-component system alkaline phosphatase synthesis response regulator PhoP
MLEVMLFIEKLKRRVIVRSEVNMENKLVKVLVADDEPDILEFIQFNLERNGFEVTTAKDGKEALEKAKEVKPDLIILDVMMPHLDGVEVCRELRALPEFDATIITFLTARSGRR